MCFVGAVTIFKMKIEKKWKIISEKIIVKSQ